jgi:hypothetical protein
VDAKQTTDNVGYAISVFLLYLFDGLIAIDDAGLHQNGDDAISFQTYLVYCDFCGLQGSEYWIHSEDIALNLMVDEGMLYVFTQMLLVAWLECVAHGGSQVLQDLECLFLFFGCEFKRCFVHCRSLLLMIYLLSCYNSSIHFCPDLVLSQMAKLAPIKAPSPINIVYSSILFLIYRYTS